MKYMIASDIHGNVQALRELISRMYFEKPAKLILLGDLYSHGPRNPFPESYDPMATAKLLNEHEISIIAVRGNCDAEVDQSISDFKFKTSYRVNFGNVNGLFIHGHNLNEEKHLSDCNVLIYGHTHEGFIKKKGKKIIANCGSIGLPKNNSSKSFIILDDFGVTLKDLSGRIIDMVKIGSSKA